MSVDQNAIQQSTDDAARAGLRGLVEAWFVERGVPQFAERDLPADQLRLVVPLVVPLAVLVAFEVGTAPKLQSLPALLIVPPVVVALAAWARPFIWQLLGFEQPPIKLRLARVAGLLALLVALSAVLERTDWPPPWSDAWVDFNVILLAEFASMVVFTREVWSGAGERLARLRRRLVALTVGAVLFFAVLPGLDQGAVIDSRRLLNALVPGERDIPLALPALVCMLLILALAERISRAAAAPSTNRASPWMAICYPAVPLLVLVLAAQTTILREADALGWARAWLPPAMAVILFALSAAAWRMSSTVWWTTSTPTTQRRPAWERIFQGAGNPLFLAPLLAASLIGYPALAETGFGIEVFGWDVVLGTVAILMFAMYVLLVLFFVWFGLLSMLREVRNDVMHVVQGVAGGLPLLLVFATFFALTAETWEIVVETSTAKFLSLIGLVVALTLGVLFLLANLQLGDAQSQLTAPESPDDRDQRGNRKPLTPWERLRQQALRKEPRRDGSRTAVLRELFDAIPPPPDDAELSPALKRRMRVNALVVIAVYQALVLVPVGLSALLLFWVVGRLAVSSSVAAEWIYGDNAGAPEQVLLDRLSFLGEPWTRVPVVLAAFSVLYLSVTLLTNQEHRTYFFSAASAALRQRLAVRVAYRLYLNPAPVSDPEEAEEEAPEAGATAPPKHQPAAMAVTTNPDTS